MPAGPFALAWNLDEEYLFHNGLSREEVRLGAVRVRAPAGGHD